MPRMALVALLLVSGCKTGQLFQSGTNPPPDAASYAAAGDVNDPATASPAQVAAENSRSAAAESIPVALERGNRAFEQNRLAEAKTEYLKVLQIQPQHAEAHHRLAVIADNEKDFPTAVQHYLRALEASPSDPDLHSDLGYSYLLQGRYEESRGSLQYALELNASHPQAINNMGLLLAQQGHYNESLAMFRRTGSEDEAQRKIAKLFPNGPPQEPGALNEYADAGDDGSSQLASYEGFADENADPGEERLDSVPPKTREVMEMMRKAREEGISARRTQDTSSPSIWDQQAWTQQAEHAVAATQQPLAGQVPDHRLNDVMSQIDRLPADAIEPYPGLGELQQSARPTSVGVADAGEYRGTNAEPWSGPVINPSRSVERVAANPQDAMDVWPPESTPAPTSGGVLTADVQDADPWSDPQQGIQPARFNTEQVHPAATGMGTNLGQAGLGTPAGNANPWGNIPPGVNTSAGQQAGGTGYPGESYTRAPTENSLHDPRHAPTGANPIESARLVGMNAGPGQMFPVPISTAGAPPSASLAPGTGSRMGGTDYAAPHEFSNQPFDASTSQARSAHNPPDAYDQMLTRQNNELNGMQRSMHAERGLAQPAPGQFTNPAAPQQSAFNGGFGQAPPQSNAYDLARPTARPTNVGPQPGAAYGTPPDTGGQQPGLAPEYYQGNRYEAAAADTTNYSGTAPTALDAPSHLYRAAPGGAGQNPSPTGYQSMTPPGSQQPYAHGASSGGAGYPPPVNY